MKRVLPVAVLFAILLALVVAREVARSRLDEGLGASDQFVPLAATPFEPKDAARIEVTAPGATEPAYVVERLPSTSATGDRWVVTKPFRAPGHPNHVDALLKAVATGDAELRADDADALRDFDLVPERSVRLKVADAQGKVLSHVAVGRSTGARGAFVRLLADASDARAFGTTTDLRGLLGLGRADAGDAEPEAPKATQFRDRDFPQVKTDTAKRIEVVAPGRRVAFEKKDGKWAVAEGGPGEGAKVNEPGLKQLLEHFGPEFRARDLADPGDLAKLGLAEPQHVVTVTLEDGSTKRVLGAHDAAKDAWFVRLDAQQDPDVVYEASTWDGQRLFPGGSGLFTFDAVDVPEETTTRVVVERPVESGGETPRRIEMSREGTKPSDDWKLVAPDWPLVARQSSLRGLASVVRNLKPIDWVDATELPSADLVVRAGPRDAADDALATFRIGGKAPSGKDRLATLPGRPGRVFVLAEGNVDRIDVAPTSLYEAKVLHGWAEPEIAAVRAEGAAPFAVERGEKGWTLVRGDGRTDASADAVRTWVEALLALETREPVAGGDPAEATVTVEKKDGTRRSLALSAVKDGQRTVTVAALSFPTDRGDLLPAPESLAAGAAKPAEEPAPKPDEE